MPPRAPLQLRSLSLRPHVPHPSNSSLRRSAASFVTSFPRHASSSSSGSGSNSTLDPSLNPNPSAKPQTNPSAPSRPSSEAKGPNMDQMPHITEESAAMSKAVGEAGPEVTQGTPVSEAVQGEKKTQENLPKVMQDALKGQKRGLHTTARRLLPPGATTDLSSTAAAAPPPPMMPPSNGAADQAAAAAARTLAQLEDAGFAIDATTARMVAAGELPDPHAARLDKELRERAGLKFAYPEGRIPRLPREAHRRRQDGPAQEMDCVAQVTNLIMKHGKKAAAQKNMALILSHLRTNPAPQLTSKVPLLTDPLTGRTYGAATLALDPATYLTVALDSVAPLMRLRSVKGIAGGGASTQIPKGLSLRQRRRTAVGWILDAVDKGRSGLQPFHRRFADEIVKIVEGRSAAWEKRNALHRLATTNRSNIGARVMIKKKVK